MAGIWNTVRAWFASPTPQQAEEEPAPDPPPVVERNLALEAAIRGNPSDPGVVSLYADWLMEQGDLGGEYLALSVDEAGLDGEQRRAVSDRRLELEARQPGLRLSVPSDANVTWGQGLIRSVVLTKAGPEEQAFLEHRWACALESLRGPSWVLDSLKVDAHVDCRATDEIPRLEKPPVIGTDFTYGKVRLTTDLPEHYHHALIVETTFRTPDGERTLWWGTSFAYTGLPAVNDVSFRCAHLDRELVEGWRIRARLTIRGGGKRVFHYRGEHRLEPCEPFTDGPFAEPDVLGPTGTLPPTPPRWTIRWPEGEHRHGHDTEYTITNGTKTHRLVPEHGSFSGPAGNDRFVAWSEYYGLRVLDTRKGRVRSLEVPLSSREVIGMNDHEVWGWSPSMGDVYRFKLPNLSALPTRNRLFMHQHMLTHRGASNFAYHPDPDRAAWLVFPDPHDERGLVGWLNSDGTVGNALIRDTGEADEPLPGAFGWVDVLADGTIEIQGSRGVWRINDGVVTLWNRA